MEILTLALLLQLAKPRPAIQNAEPPTAATSQPAQKTEKPTAVKAQQPISKRPENNPSGDTGKGERRGKRTVHWLGFDWELADFLNLGIAIGTIATFFTAIAAVRRASAANKTALTAATDASETATEALKLTEESMQLAHRPSLHFFRASMFINLNADEIKITVPFKNTGTDTAHAVMTYISLKVDRPLPTREDVEKITPLDRVGDVAAEAAGNFTKMITLTAPFWQTYENTKRCSLVVVVTCRDLFRNHYRRSMVGIFQNGHWQQDDEWSWRKKVTPETDRTWDRY